MIKKIKQYLHLFPKPPVNTEEDGDGMVGNQVAKRNYGRENFLYFGRFIRTKDIERRKMDLGIKLISEQI